LRIARFGWYLVDVSAGYALSVMVKDRGARAELTDVHAFIEGLYGTDLHAKRIASLAGATLAEMPGGGHQHGRGGQGNRVNERVTNR
jgi:hypothetical protein